MKRLLHPLVSAVLCFGLFFSFSMVAPVLAEVVTYPGAPLQNVDGHPNALAPSGSDSGKSNSVKDNRVTLNSGTVGYVYGAINRNDTEAVTGNTVEINGGSVNGVIYYGQITGGRSYNNASGNTVKINGGSVSGFVHGGYAPSSRNGIASDNTVEISGGTVEGAFIYGGSTGMGEFSSIPSVEGGSGSTGDASWSAGSTATASNNTVTIRGTPTFGSDVWLYGGISASPTGNTLNLHTAGLTVYHMSSFQKLHFYLPATLEPNGTMLTVARA